MSENLATERLRLGLVDWVNQTTAPDTGAGATAAGIGSIMQRSGGGTSQLWHKIGTPDDDWVVQNLWNLRVFNVVTDYGAVGDGVTNDNVPVQNAIAAAQAAGGGIIYFPPRPLGYAFYKPAGVNFPFDLNNHQNILFLGDGPSSLLQQTFSGIGGDFYLFQISNLSRRIGFHNLGWVAVGDFLDEQTHFVNIRGIGADASSPDQMEFLGNWFGRCWGDAIRGLGQSTRVVGATRILKNAFNNEIGRSNIGVQRYWKKFTIVDNWMTGVDDNNVDFEPTAGADDTEVQVVGNQVGKTGGTSAFTVGGNGAEPTAQSTWAYNIVTPLDATGGGAISGISTSRNTFIGNIIGPVQGGTTAPISLFRAQIDNVVAANICVVTRADFAIPAISIKGDATADAHDNIMADNIGDVIFSGRPMLFERMTGGQMVGNMCLARGNEDSSDAAIYRYEPIQDVAGTNLFKRASLIGNWGKTLAAVRQHYLVSPPSPPGSLRNLVATGNYGRGTSTSGVRFPSAGGGLYIGARACRSNMCIGVTSNNVSTPTEGVAIDGAGGVLAPGIFQSRNTSEPEATTDAPIGSMAIYAAGSDASVLWTKGAGTGNTGWDREGPSEINFGVLSAGVGTGAQYLSPGMILALPSATEIQIPVRAGTIRNLRVKQVAGTGAVTVTYRVRKNGSSAGAPSVTMNVTATTGSETAASLDVATGDLISIETVKSGVPATAPTFVVVTFELAGPSS